VPLYTVDPIYFNFSVPQQIAPALKPGSNVTITVDAFPGRSFTGSVTAVNPQINADLRSIDIQATIPNTQQELLPGMFGRVELALGRQQQVLSVPLTAVSYAPYGDSVYVVERKVDDSGAALTVVRQQIVQLGERKGDLVAVIKGLREGDEVVTTGTSKLRPEAAIAINNQVLPSASENPTVKDS
jgi:membrane fusion protein (multidrug efflux system)